MQNEKTKIRCSYLQSYNDCARRTAAKIIADTLQAQGYELEKRSQGAGAVIGTACHRGSYHYLACLKDGVPVTAQDAIDAAISKYDESTAEGIQFDTRTNSNRVAHRQIATILTNLLAGIKPEAGQYILDLERRIEADIEDGFVLSGQPDVALISSLDDTKFGGVLRPAQCQFGGYILLRRSIGHVVKKCRMIYAPRVSVGSAYPGVQKIEYNPGICASAAYSTAQNIIADIKAYRETENPSEFQANPMSQMCSSRYCEAHGTDWCELTKESK